MRYSRRKLLLISLASVLPASNAQSFLPVPPLPVIFRVFKLIYDLVEAIDAIKSVVRWTKDATAKLDELMNASVGVTDELKQLNILLKKSDFSDFVEKDLKADIRQLKFYRDRLEKYQQLDSANQTDILAFTRDLEHNVVKSLEYGLAAYETAYTGTIVVRSLYKYISRPAADQRTFFESIAATYGSWLDPSQSDSPAKLKRDEQGKIDSLKEKASKITEDYKHPVPYLSYTGVYVDVKIGGDLNRDKGFGVTATSNWLGYKPPGIDMFANSIKDKVQKDLDTLTTEYRSRMKIIAGLDEVRFQLEQYHQSLLDVANGGRLALARR